MPGCAIMHDMLLVYPFAVVFCKLNSMDQYIVWNLVTETKVRSLEIYDSPGPAGFCKSGDVLVNGHSMYCLSVLLDADIDNQKVWR